MIELAILIPTTPERKPLLDRLLQELSKQRYNRTSVDFLVFQTPLHNKETNQFSHGWKRNELIKQALSRKAKAIAFHDDDDMPGETYIERGLEFARSEYDCAELWGDIYWNGKKGKPFHHIIDCVNPKNGKLEWWEDNQFYYRTINHLNFQKLSLSSCFPFPDQGFGEDGKQSESMSASGVFKTMMPIPETLYNYFNGNPKHAI